MADAISVLGAGRVLQAGPPREVYLRPRSPAVARALGSPPVNELAAVRRDGGWTAEDGTPLCPAPRSGAERARLGVRPEHVEPAGGLAPAVIEVVENAGPHQVLLARFAGTRIHLLAPRSFAARPGQTIHPRLDPARVVVWDSA
jgi:ABC-type sugar transport system ATPase subunit